MSPDAVEYNPYAYPIHEDPYPTYAALRAHAPAYRSEALDFWALSRHADVLAAFKDTERFSNDHGVSLDPESWGPQATAGTSFLALDPPNHTRLRGLVSKGFTARRARPGDDLLSVLLEVEADGERLEESEILSFANLMIVAGNETTTKMLANAVYWLWRHPEQRALVREAPAERIPGWVEETLRFDNSTQMLARRVARDVELHGQTLRAGSRALLLVGSGNRDERVFERADQYDVLRDTTHSLSFGRGVH